MSSGEVITRILGVRTVGPALEPSREWVFDDRRIVIDGHDVSVYMGDRIQRFVSLRPVELARRLDAGKYQRLSDETGNRICYENAVPYDSDGNPYEWGFVLGRGSIVERTDCYLTEDEAKSAAAEAWSMIPEEERKSRYCLVGRIEPTFMITKTVAPVWWPDVF